MPRLAEDSRPWISQVGRSYTSLQEFLLWSALCTLASASVIPSNRCRRIASFSVSSVHAYSGWDGSVSTRAARWRPAVWLRARLWQRTSVLPPQQSDGPQPSGSATARPVYSAESPAQWPGLSPSHQPQVL